MGVHALLGRVTRAAPKGPGRHRGPFLFLDCAQMFTVEYRARVREALIEKARRDARIESAAAVGGSAHGEGDPWSDVDLSFGVATTASRDEVLEGWTRDIRRDYSAVTLFDLPVQSSIYRVFLFPGALQVDLSFTTAAGFGARGPSFALLFGTAVELARPSPASPRQEFGLAVHHAVRARYCIARGRPWQAEHWTHQVRDLALTLACRRLGLEAGLARGFDALPEAILNAAEAALVRTIEPTELLRALAASVQLLMTEASGAHADAVAIESMLREILD